MVLLFVTVLLVKHCHLFLLQIYIHVLLLIAYKCILTFFLTDNTLAIVLGSVGAVLAVVVMVIAIVVYTKKQKK